MYEITYSFPGPFPAPPPSQGKGPGNEVDEKLNKVFLTKAIPIDLDPHGDVPMPCVWHHAEVTGSERTCKSVPHYGVPVTVTSQ